jgi:endoglucanase
VYDICFEASGEVAMKQWTGRATLFAGGAVLVAACTAAMPTEAAKVTGTMRELTRNPFEGQRLFVDPTSAARREADALRATRPADAALLERIAAQPTAVWVGDWNRDVRRDVAHVLRRARVAGAMPVLVAYNIPARDCGSYSAGGARSGAEYRRWVRDVAAGLEGGPAAVVLEPDALAGLDCLPAAGRAERLVLLQDAAAVLHAAGAAVYIDAGHVAWQSPETMAGRLRQAGVEHARGFALNVSNFHGNDANVAYGERLSGLLGGMPFVLDSSRNGRGIASADDWCNPRGQALGTLPVTRTAHPLLDAMLWIKRPGESDGTCNGGPAAGQWWSEYALELARLQTPAMAVALHAD